MATPLSSTCSDILEPKRKGVGKESGIPLEDGITALRAETRDTVFACQPGRILRCPRTDRLKGGFHAEDVARPQAKAIINCLAVCWQAC